MKAQTPVLIINQSLFWGGLGRFFYFSDNLSRKELIVKWASKQKRYGQEEMKCPYGDFFYKGLILGIIRSYACKSRLVVLARSVCSPLES